MLFLLIFYLFLGCSLCISLIFLFIFCDFFYFNFRFLIFADFITFVDIYLILLYNIFENLTTPQQQKHTQGGEMKGLIIKEFWLNKIFNNEKTWEIRGSDTKIRGKIYLIQSGTKHIYGECEIIDSKKLSLTDYQNNSDKHCIHQGLDALPYKNTFAWIIANAKKYPQPIPYQHPCGAIIWVNID